MLPRTTQDIVHDKETTPLIKQGTSGSTGQNARTLDAQDIPPRGTGHDKIDIWLREQRKLNTGWARAIFPAEMYFAMAVLYSLPVIFWGSKRMMFMEIIFGVVCALAGGLAAGVKFWLDRHVQKVAESSMKVALMDGDEGNAAQFMYNRAVPVDFVDKKNEKHEFHCFPPAQFYPVPLPPTSFPLFRETSFYVDETHSFPPFVFASTLVVMIMSSADDGRDALPWWEFVFGITLGVGLMLLLWSLALICGPKYCVQERRKAATSQSQEWKGFIWMQEQMGWWGVLAMEQSLGNERMCTLKAAMREEERRYVDERNKLLQTRIAQGRSSQHEYEALSKSINVELLNGAV